MSRKIYVLMSCVLIAAFVLAACAPAPAPAPAAPQPTQAPAAAAPTAAPEPTAAPAAPEPTAAPAAAEAKPVTIQLVAHHDRGQIRQGALAEAGR